MANLRISGDDLESLLDLLAGGAAAHVQEVGGGTAVQLNDVHRGHSQSSPVNLMK